MTETEYLKAQLKLLNAEFEFLISEDKKIQNIESAYARGIETLIMSLAIKTVSHKIQFICYEIEKLKEK